MLKILIPSFLLLLSSVSYANDINLVPSDDSPYTQICIAAAESDAAIDAKLQEYGIRKSEISELSCNGMSLGRFAAKYRDAVGLPPVPIRVFAFQKSESSAATNLCIAAATSNEDYASLKSELYTDLERYRVYTLQCNGMSLRKFARTYGNDNFKI